jgi:hypothetical protein
VGDGEQAGRNTPSVVLTGSGSRVNRPLQAKDPAVKTTSQVSCLSRANAWCDVPLVHRPWPVGTWAPEPPVTTTSEMVLSTKAPRRAAAMPSSAACTTPW